MTVPHVPVSHHPPGFSLLKVKHKSFAFQKCLLAIKAGSQLHFGLFQISRVHVAVTRQGSRISSGPSALIGTACPGKLPGEPGSQREAKPVSQSSPALPSKTEMIWVEAQLPETVPAGLPCLAVPTTLSLHSAVHLGGQAPLPSPGGGGTSRGVCASRPCRGRPGEQHSLPRSPCSPSGARVCVARGVCVAGGGGLLFSFQDEAQPSCGGLSQSHATDLICKSERPRWGDHT